MLTNEPDKTDVLSQVSYSPKTEGILISQTAKLKLKIPF
ncbi:hypothetical protein JCM19233_7160 [Vibrio astriarenae]|nr:hypothetical protein JCM19233_7160 [Vibrio sp. C7]